MKEKQSFCKACDKKVLSRCTNDVGVDEVLFTGPIWIAILILWYICVGDKYNCTLCGGKVK